MGEILNTFAFWLRSTSLSEAIRVQPWLWPVFEIIHFFGLSLLIGVAGFFDLRLLGFMKDTVPLAAAHKMIPWAMIGFGLCAVTGATFFVGAPDQYVTNLAFYPKLLFIVIGLANAQFFETAYGSRLARLATGRGCTSTVQNHRERVAGVVVSSSCTGDACCRSSGTRSRGEVVAPDCLLEGVHVTLSSAMRSACPRRKQKLCPAQTARTR